MESHEFIRNRLEENATMFFPAEELKRGKEMNEESLPDFLEAWHVSNWKDDPYSQGGWSVPLVGHQPIERKLLSTPLTDSFVLAGEAYNMESPSTVDGASQSGIEAAMNMAKGLFAGDHVVIIGAGAAGTFAATELQQLVPGVVITILEARDRVGGRVRSVELAEKGGPENHRDAFPDQPVLPGSARVDMGATWLHGCDKEDGSDRLENNFLLKKARDYGLSIHPSDFTRAVAAAADGLPFGERDVYDMCGVLACEALKYTRLMHRRRKGSVSTDIGDIDNDSDSKSSESDSDSDSDSSTSPSYPSSLSESSASDKDESDYCEAENGDKVGNLGLDIDSDIDTSMATALVPYLSNLPIELARLVGPALRGVIAIDNGLTFKEMSARWTLEQNGPGAGDSFFKDGYASLLFAELAKLRASIYGRTDEEEKRLDFPPFSSSNSDGQGHTIWLRTVVNSVDYSMSGRIILSTNRGTITASRCICTLPVSCMKSDAIKFIPSLPAPYRLALKHLSMGSVEKVILRFSKRWWPVQPSKLGDRNILHWYGPTTGFMKPMMVAADIKDPPLESGRGRSLSSCSLMTESTDCESTGPLPTIKIDVDKCPFPSWVEWLDLTDGTGVPMVMGFVAGAEACRKYHGFERNPDSDREVALLAVSEFRKWADNVTIAPLNFEPVV